MHQLTHRQLWFVCGSQHLYATVFAQVEGHARTIAEALSESAAIPLEVVARGVLTTPDEIRRLCREADSDPECAGLILWMHTFSPAKMWIGGLSTLQKPFAHLHTQLARDLPWAGIDMDYMNLHQSAHGDPREASCIPGCGWSARSWWATGPIPRCRPGWEGARLGLARPPGRPLRPLRRQHARGGRHGRGQGFGRACASGSR